jgi:hypothetical protein
MRRRITLAVTTVLAVAILVVPLTASASLGPNPITLSANWSTTASMMGFGADPSAPEGVSTPSSAPTALQRARTALGTMPPLGDLGDLNARREYVLRRMASQHEYLRRPSHLIPTRHRNKLVGHVHLRDEVGLPKQRQCTRTRH